MAYKKLHTEIEVIIQSRLETIFSQLNLNDEDLENVFNTNKKLSNTNIKKKSISGYNLFAREMFPDIKRENEGVMAKDVMRTVANLWKDIDQQTKDDYNERAKSIKPKTKEDKKQRQPNNKSNSKNKVLDNNNKKENNKSKITKIHNIKK